MLSKSRPSSSQGPFTHSSTLIDPRTFIRFFLEASDAVETPSLLAVTLFAAPVNSSATTEILASLRQGRDFEV